MRRFFYFTFILVVPILFIMALLSVAPSAADTNAVLTVNSTADSGPGTLREALMTAVNGDTIDFDTAVFPPGSPASIVLSSVLPEIITDNLTITASAAGVILDGSGIGVTPEPLLLDDVSLTLDGGPNELNNGDFGSTLDHWRPWDNNPGATRSLNGSDFHSSPNSYEWDTVATAGSTRTVYDTDPRSDPHSQWPYDVGNTAWISATGGSLVELDFWFKYGGVGVSLRALHSDGWEEHFAGWYFDWESSWVSRTISATLPGGIVAVALEFDHNHSQLQSNGLNINASGVVVQGLQIVNFPGHGVSLYGSAQNNLIGGDRNIGSGPMGQGNLISGNGFGDQHSSCGVYIGDPGTGFNTVQGNYIGVDLSGANPWGNGGMGVELWFATHDNLIIDNVISGNGGHGVNMLNDDVGNTIEDNLIGVDANGQYEIGNSWGGIFLGNGSWDDMAPSQTQILSNVVSGNYGNGIKIEDSTAVSNTIQNNIIGADATGTIPIPNDGDGVSLRNGANNTLVGGSLPGEGNIIFANQSSGVSISDYGTMSNTVEGNQIGFGLGAVRQAFPYDAAISPAYAADCTLYAATVNDGIFKTADCGNTWTDLNVGLTESSLTQVKIPPDAPNALTAYALADNGFLFVTVDGGASWNLHSTAPEGFDRRNLALAADFTVSPTMYIAAEHWSWGIYGDNPGVFKSTDGGITWTQMNNGLSDDHVRYVAVSPDMAEKDTLFALTHSGLEKSTDGGANWTAVTTIPDANELSGIVLSPNYASDQTVFVTAHTGRVYISNDGGSSWTGVDSLRGDPRYPAFSPDFASDNTLCHGGGWNDWFYCSNDSGATWWESSTGLPGHLRDEGTGILFSPNFSGDTTVFVASIGGMARSLDSGATWETLRDLNNIGNGDGVQINNGASHNHILDNIIGNNFQGVSIHDTDTAYNIVAGNLIGTDAAGAAPLSNASHGIGLSDGHDNLIGGPGAGDGNLVSGNMEFGIGMWNTATVSNTIQGNIIGTDASGSYAISNRDAGIHLNGPNHNYILDNLVSGNGQNGIDLCCTGTEYNVISGNFVGTDASGTAVIPNRHTGVSLGSGSSYNLIGGSTAAERNLISGNGDNGVGIGNSDTMSNTVSGNYIGTDVTGTGMLGNGQNSDGIHIHNGAAYNIIGGATAAEGNLISGNYRVGVSINGEDNGTNRNVVQNNYIGTDASGMNALGNGVGEQYTAVELYYTDNNLIKDNLISGNNSNGIYIQGDTAFGNLIEGNLIGTDATGTQPLFRLDVEESEESEANQSARCTPMETAPEGFDERLLEDRKCTAAANPQTETDITVLTSNNGAGIVLEHGSHLNTIGLSNIIAFNNDHGVIVDGFNTLSNTISQNSIFHNNGIGINLRNGGNSQLAAPSVMGINLATGVVTGTACANCTVEVFSDDADEGRIFEGTTTANGAGDFAFNKGSALAGPNITATATDATGNTSPFSALFEILWVNLGLDHTQWALQRLGLSYTPVDVTDIGTVTLSDYDVILVGSTADWVPDDVYQPLLNHKSAIDAYVQGGGALVALSNGGDWNQYATSLDWSWVPVDLTWYGQTRRTHILTPTHPLAEGLTDTDFFYWWGAHGEAFTSWNWPGAESVVWASADGRSALLAGSYGAGQMILSGMFPDVDDQGDTTLNAMLHWATGHWPDHSPLVTRATPDPDGLGATNTRLRLRFDQLLDPATVTPGVLTVVADSGTVVGSFTYLPDISEIFFTPAAPLTPGEMVTATLSAAVTDWQGNPLDGDGDGTGGDDFTWRFVVNSGAVLMVDNSANDGSGTLREAMQLSLPGDTIRFDAAVFPPATPTTISLDWNLDDMTAGYVTIDAANTGVILDADNADWVGLSIRSDGNVVQGLTIINGRGNNIYIGDGAAYNLIGGNRNSGAGPNGEGNTISYGHEWGIFVQGGGTISNTFLGNHVGVDPTGTAAWPNGLDWGASGLFIEQGADYTVIGSNVPGERNVLSGNNGDGLDINESYYVTVLNNYLGTDASGMNPVPNNQCGLDLQAGSRYVYLEDNLFSGNNSCGAQVDDPGTDYNEFVNNQFGLDAAGTTPLPNHRYGLYVLDFVEQTLITGNTFANDLLGINIFGSSRNTVVDNYIGTDASGTAVFGHSMAGIWVDTWDFGSVPWVAEENLIAQNVIAHNGAGVVMADYGFGMVFSNTLTENSIYANGGLDWNGILYEEGIALFDDANAHILPPVVNNSNSGAGTADGTACPNCIVEIFSDNDDEGKWYEGTVTANGSGNWSFNKGSAFSGANVQATATDAAGNTSEFSSGPPQISHVDPVDAVPGMNDLGVNIFGAGFRDNDPIGVDFGADVYVNQIIYHGPDHVTAYIDVDPAAALGLRDVTLTNYDGQWDTLVGGFEIVSTPPPPPVVTAVTPDEAAPDTNGALYISGADFIDRPVITFSGPITVVWTQFNDPTEIVIEVVVADTAVPGSYDLTLTNPDGQSDTLLNAITIVNPYFTDVAPAHNVDVSSGEHGAAWGDLDGDGWLDLAIGSGELFTSTAASFNDATAAAGLDPIGYFGGVAWADHDNDSDLNLLSSWAKVYRQNSLPFSKIWDDSSNQPTLAWVDYDLDGDVDVYASGQLYRQDGSATFTNVTTASGLSISMADEWLSSVWADYDDDGNPDLYLTCNGCPNLLFHNNGNGTFTDVTTAAGVGDTGSGHGANWADYDNDGDFDLFIANNNDQYNVLYRNDGAGTFTDVSAAAGFHDQTNNGTGTNWLDYNLDGWIDVFVVNRYHENRLYRNNGDGTFTDYRMASGVNDGRDSEGSTVGDYDNDGDPDIYVVSGSDGDGTPNFLYENNVSGQHWLKVKLEGVLSNHSAIGAIIKIYGAGPIQTRQIAGSNGYMSQDALEAIFGLGSYAGQVTIEVIWPSTVVDTISAVAADQEIVIVESTTYLHDLGMVGILPANPLPANVPFAPLATVRNFGQNTETGASVQCQISHGGTTVYNQTLTAGPITPAAWASISFLNYTPTTSGTYTIQCTVTIAGDERPLNDSLTQTFDVTQQIADAWTKDNDHDDGNVPSGSNNWYGSPDVWVRWAADGGLVHQDPIAGQTNTVYVRLRNRGNVTITGTLDVTWIEPSLGTRCGDWAPIGTVAFNNLLPGEQRIVSLPWVPTRSGHTCMQSIIDSPADPYDRGLECSPQWVPWDNNISWRNINIFHNPTTRGVTDIKTADVRLVNVYAQSKDVDLVVDRMTFPKTDTLTVLLPADLFDRWWNYGRGWQDNITVDPTTREIIVTGDISGTIGAIPMTADEEVTVTLRFDGQTGLEFEMGIRERIDGVTMGGVGYQWIIPDTTTPTVVSVTPTDSMSDVALAAPIVMTFDEEIGPLSVVLTANPPLNNPSPTWNDAGTVFTVTHSGLTEGTVYALSVMANDAAGNPLSTPHTWSFTTMSTGYELYLPVLLKP